MSPSVHLAAGRMPAVTEPLTADHRRHSTLGHRHAGGGHVHAAQLPGRCCRPAGADAGGHPADTAARFPDASALDDGRSSLSYAQLLAEVRPRAGNCTWPARRGRQDRGPDPVGHQRALHLDPCDAAGRCGLRARWTPTTLTNGPNWCSARPGWPASCAPAGRSSRTASIHAPSLPQAARPPTTTRGSSSPPAPPAHPKGVAVQHRCGARLWTRRPGSSCRTSRWARRTGSWPACPWPSTPPARRCGWRGATAPASCRPRGRWSAPAWTSARG